MKLITLSLAAVCSMLLQLTCLAQPQFRSCGSVEVLNRQLKEDPGMLQRMDQIEQFTQSYIQKQKTQRTAAATITVPVVIHVVYNTTGQNISDDQVKSQIAILNRDYAKLNSDTAGIPPVFRSIAANTGIQFCLAQRDPNGNTTTGILRKSTTKASFTTDDAVKKASTGGDDPWDATKYLNIWVCYLSGNLLGYATLPGGITAADGVVITFTAFGDRGTAAAPYNMGRTATHEVGHWLNLRHVWGDADCGDDLVADTPTQQTANYGCPSWPHVSCNNNGDMCMNYMDYVDDRCMFMFSSGQSARMNALFATGGVRASILSSMGCVAPATCLSPSGLTASSITQISATLNWTAITGAAAYTVQYKASTASTWTTMNAATASLNISGLTAGTTYQFQVQTTCSSGTSAYSSIATFTTLPTPGNCIANVYEPNNTMSQIATITTGTDVHAMIETGADIDWFGFANTSAQPNIQVSLTNLPKDYTLSLYKGGTLLSTSANTGTTSESIKYNTTAVGTYWIRVSGNSTNYSNTSCYSLRVDLSSGTQTATCDVPSALNTTNITQTSATLNWGAVTNATSYSVQYRVQNAATWTSANVSTKLLAVSGLTASTTYEFQVRTNCSSGSSAYSASGTFTTLASTPTCNVPAGLNASNISQTSATLSWGAVTNATSYGVQYRVQNTSAWTSATANTASLAVSSLTASTTYEFQVRTNCSSGSSAYSASGTFTTLANSTTTSCTVNAYEPNNTMSQVTPITVNTEVNAMIEIASDVDWFSFANSSGAPNIQVSLYNLPKDYTLALYKGGTLLATSATAGTANETIKYNTSVAGTYWIRVYGSSSAYSNTQCYSVKAQTSSSPFFKESEQVFEERQANKKEVQIYPNPSSGEFTINFSSVSSGQLVARVIDIAGNTLFTNSYDLSEGENSIHINLPDVAKGLYLLDLNDGTENTVHKIMIR